MGHQLANKVDWPSRVGLSLTVLFALFLVAGTSIALSALGFMLIVALADGHQFVAVLRRSPSAWAALALFVYVAARGVAGAFLHPAWADLQYEGLWDWLLLLLFPLVAWFVQGSERRVRIILITALLGLVIAIARLTDWSHFLHDVWFGSKRADWGMTYLQSALFLGTVLLGWIAFAERLIGADRWRWLRGPGWLLFAGLLCEMIVLTQSRAVLMSLVVLAPALVIVKIWLQSTRQKRMVAVSVFVVFIAVAVALIFAHRGSVENRLHGTAKTLHGMQTLQLDQVPKTSLGKRMYLYNFGGHRWLDKPVFGWGPGIEAATVFADAPIDPKTNAHFPDLHNGYLEVLVRFGVVGFLLSLTMTGCLLIGLYRAWQRGFVRTDMVAFLTFSSILGALVNLTNFRLVHMAYRFYVIFLVGLVFAHELRMLATTQQTASQDDAAASDPSVPIKNATGGQQPDEITRTPDA
ncbi:O-antigen ligase family protein [Salinisphaera sp. USBA-960]|nr:O-antigen ligase family protein [Salifodinibacter halophilus]NNC26993.1 O-antigen ligase family protein [Salifodinibacter halophilus]